VDGRNKNELAIAQGYHLFSTVGGEKGTTGYRIALERGTAYILLEKGRRPAAKHEFLPHHKFKGKGLEYPPPHSKEKGGSARSRAMEKGKGRKAVGSLSTTQKREIHRVKRRKKGRRSQSPADAHNEHVLLGGKGRGGRRYLRERGGQNHVGTTRFRVKGLLLKEGKKESLPISRNHPSIVILWLGKEVTRGYHLFLEKVKEKRNRVWQDYVRRKRSRLLHMVDPEGGGNFGGAPNWRSFLTSTQL